MKYLLKTTIAFLLISAIACTKETVKTSFVSQFTSSDALAALKIGDTYHGGIIFYIDNTGQHGLVVSKTDLVTSSSSAQISWNNGKNIVTGATATAVGTGAANTAKIIAAQGATGDYAALLCHKFKAGIYKDWYLPSKDELNLLYKQSGVVGAFGQYWSSSEVSKGKAWDQVFGGGYKEKDSKSFTLNVRAISSF